MFEGLLHLLSLDRPTWEVARDVFDILVVALLVYRALLVLRGTQAMQMGLGLLAFSLLYIMAKWLQLATLLSLLSWLATSAILLIVVVFQNDIRRALVRVGSKAWLSRGQDAQERIIDEVVAASTELARHRMGALICLERDASVMEFVTNDGIKLDAHVTQELLVSLFIPESYNKAHDGAVLIRDYRIARAGIFFPMPAQTKIADPTLGSRHRAAIGITEETDCIMIVVSEERGTISLCSSSAPMEQNIDGASLRRTLLGFFGKSMREADRTLVGRVRTGLGLFRGPDPRPPIDPELAPASEDGDDASRSGQRAASKSGSQRAASKSGSQRAASKSGGHHAPILPDKPRAAAKSGKRRAANRSGSQPSIPPPAGSDPVAASNDEVPPDVPSRPTLASEHADTPPPKRPSKNLRAISVDDYIDEPSAADMSVSRPMIPTKLPGEELDDSLAPPESEDDPSSAASRPPPSHRPSDDGGQA